MRQIFFLLLVLYLSGCKVGPNYYPPEVILPLEFNEDQPDQTFVIEDEDLICWWTIFNDPVLNELLEIAAEQNYDYLIALEAVYQARSQYWIQFTQILPEFDAQSVTSRFRTSQSFRSSRAASAADLNGSTISPYQSFFQVGLDAIWELDLFGKFQRAADASYDLWQASIDEMRGVQITVLSEVANTYTAICALQKKQDIAKQVVDIDGELLELVQVKQNAGLADELEVENAIATLAADKAQLNLIQAVLKQTIYSLAILLGMPPESVIEDFPFHGPIPASEGKVPVSIPSELLRRRPDIRSAERHLAAATEEIGVAVAELFPSISLTGSSSSFAANPLQGANVGYSSDRLSKLFKPASLIWGIGDFITVPMFDFGKRAAAVDVQIALRNQAYYAFQQAVIAALQETEQALAVYFNEEKREQNLYQEVQANWRAFLLTKDRFQAGLVDILQVIDAKENWLISLNLLTDSQQALTTDLIAIYKALGGEW